MGDARTAPHDPDQTGTGHLRVYARVWRVRDRPIRFDRAVYDLCARIDVAREYRLGHVGHAAHGRDGRLVRATISVFARSELQVVQMIPFTIIPQVFFSGLIPLDLIPYGLGNLSYVMPIFYGATAIKEVMVYGSGFAGIWGYVLGLVVYAGVLYVLNLRALGKYRGH